MKNEDDNQRETGKQRIRRDRKSRNKLLRALTPHELRMASVVRHPIPSEDSLEGRLLKLQMEKDIAFQLQLRELGRLRFEHARAVSLGGSGFQMAKLLRYFHADYENRISMHGLNSLPLSFNVVEAFLEFTPALLQFLIREEIEYLLSLDEYFQWYDTQVFLPDISLIEGVLQESVIYSYDMRTSEDEYRMPGERERRISGISMIRHGSELTCMLLAGENPPLLSDADVEKMLSQIKPAKGKENLIASSELTIKDRYLDGAPGFAKVIVLTRLDLRTRQHDVRYVLVDGGINFTVLTDDIEMFDDLLPEEKEPCYDAMQDRLASYQNLFSATMSLIFLPIFTADRSGDIHDLTVSTEVHSRLSGQERAEISSKLKYTKLHLQRAIRCLPKRTVVEVKKRKLSPPEFEFHSEGYWKSIGPTEIGEDKDGNAVAGRTWVSRHEQWTTKKPEDFILAKSDFRIDGPDPGFVYIQRSAGHAANVYKIGLTRISVEQRSRELSSSTSCPLPFDVVADFRVGNCGAVETEVHKRLANCRINPKREFFRADLRDLTKTINSVIEDVCPENRL